MDDNSPHKTWQAERRNMHRLNFTASADVTELASRERFSLRMTDVGAGGCFLDALFPLPVGSKVPVTLRHGLMDFHAERAGGLLPVWTRNGHRL
jgi:hypothetical protein